MSIRNLVLPLLAVVLSTGCVNIREMIQLEEDGSGTVHFKITFPQLGLRWLPGKPGADWVRGNLPDGVHLTSFENSQTKTTIPSQDGKRHEVVAETYDVEMSFDEVTALNGIRIGPDVRNARAAAGGGTPGKAGSADAAPNAPRSGPFQRLTLVEDGDLLHFRRLIQAARGPDDIKANAMSTPGSGAKPQAFDLSQGSLVISIACPGDLVEHNAHRVEGRTLTWSFNLQEMLDHQDRDWIVKFTCRRKGNR